MTHPTITLKTANAILQYAGIKFIKHDLGYYVAYHQGRVIGQDIHLNNLVQTVVSRLSWNQKHIDPDNLKFIPKDK